MSTTELPPSDVITVEHQDHVAVVWLERPDKLNAMARGFWTEFPAIINALAADPHVRVLVIAGKGRAFTVGLDLGDFGASLMSGTIDSNPTGSGVADRMASYRTIKLMQQTFTSLATCPKPVIAAIHGYCIGAGVDLITACDIRLAAADSVFSVRETKIAMVADVGTMQRLPRIVDPGWVAEVVYTGRDFDADEAATMGLVSRILPDAEAVVKDALALAGEIAANSPLAVQGSKAVLRAGEGRTVEENLDYVALWNAAFLHSQDLSEAVQAYVERRPPQFEGR